MDRTQAKALLGENATEEQITSLLNAYHAKVKEATDLSVKLQAENAELKEKNVQLSDYEKQINELKKSQMTETEKIEAQKKELSAQLANAKILTNTIKAKSVLIGAGISEERADILVKSIVKEDEASTLSSASEFVNEFNSIKEMTKKQVTEAMANLDVKPNGSNVPPNSDTMTWEKFQRMSVADQSKFAEEHPDEFANL